MPETIPLIDVDSHIAEPADLFNGEYMDPNWRGASPFRYVRYTDDVGATRTRLLFGGGFLLDNAAYMNSTGVPFAKLLAGITLGDRGGWDVKQRLADMDVAGITHQLVNPSAAVAMGDIGDVPLATAMCRAYNDFVTDHCADGEGRVHANMLLPWQDLDAAEAELRRIADRDCCRGIIIRPAPAYPSGFIADPAFDRLYSAIAERELALVVHGTPSLAGPVGAVANHFRQGKPHMHWMLYQAMLGFPFEAWLTFAQLMFEGTLDKHPTLKVVLTESHGGWMVTALERMDEYVAGTQAFRATYDRSLDALPSEYFARQCFIVFEGDEIGLKYAAEHIANSMVWALDYPHADCAFPEGTEEFLANLAKLPEPLQKAVSWDNAARAFNLA